MAYEKIKEIVTKNPDMTAGKFDEELKKEKIDTKITNQDDWTLLYYAVRSEGPYIIGDRSIFLKVVKLLTNSGIKVNDIQDTAYTLLDRAVITKQADIIEVLLGSVKFNEEEKFNALRSTIVQGNVQEVGAFLGYVNDESRQAALELAMDNTQEEITQVLLNFITSETPNVEKNRAEPCSSSGNIVSTDQTAKPSNEQETKYKESTKDFYTSLTKGVVKVVITGLFITASVAGAVVCGIVAALVAIATGLHVKNSTLPSYKEMEENKVKYVSSGIQKV
jgi:ankyrin repeat protein